MAKPWINEQKIESPFEDWPGYIVMPKELSAEQFTKWWEKARAQVDDDTRPVELQAFYVLHHLVLGCHIEGLDWAEIQPDGSNLPSMRLAIMVGIEGMKLVDNARTLPNLPEPSKDTTASTAEK